MNSDRVTPPSGIWQYHPYRGRLHQRVWDAIRAIPYLIHDGVSADDGVRMQAFLAVVMVTCVAVVGIEIVRWWLSR